MTVEVYSPVGADVVTTHTTAQFKLGTIAKASDGQEYTYCLASGALSQYALAVIDENFVAGGGTTAKAATASGPGWPQVAFADGAYGWVLTKGRNFQGKLKDGVVVDAQLYTTTSVGIMGSDASTGNPYMIVGCRVAVAGSGAGNPGEIIASNPSFIRATAQA